MRPPFRDGGPTPEELQELAKRLEELATKANASLLKLAKIEPEALIDVFAEQQAKLLRFDESAKKRFDAAIEEARVKTLARDSFFMGCLLTSAVALKQFKREPRRTGGFAARVTSKLQDVSTGVPALWAFTLASFYAVVGSRAFVRLREVREQKTISPRR